MKAGQLAATLVLASLAGAMGFLAARKLEADTPAPLPKAPTPQVQGVEGREAVDFALPAINGPVQKLSDYRGRWVLLNFWASWCGPCREEMPLLNDWHRRLGNTAPVLGVAMDDPDAAAKVLKDAAIAYPSLVGDEAVQTIMEGLGNSLGGLPYTVLVRPDGRVQAVELGVLTAQKLAAWESEFLRAP